MQSEAKDALILRFSSLGDLVLCSGFVQKLKQHSPEGRIYFATLSQFAPLLDHFPHSLKVLEFQKKKLSHLFKMGWKSARIDDFKNLTIFDLQGNTKSLVFLFAFQLSRIFSLRAPVEVKRTPRQGFRRILSVFLRKDLLGPRKIYLEHQSLIDGDSFFPPELRAPGNGPKSGFLLAPDSQHWKKKIPSEICQKIALHILTTTPENMTLVGGVECVDSKLISDLESKFPGRVKNLLGKTKISDLPILAATHQLCICGNSAWLHISEAVGTPVLSFAGPIVEGFGFSPWKKESVELCVPLNCRPCTRHGGGPCLRSGDSFHACIRQAQWQEALNRFLQIHNGANL